MSLTGSIRNWLSERFSKEVKQRKKQVKLEQQISTLENILIVSYQNAGWEGVTDFRINNVKKFKKDNAQRYFKPHLHKLKLHSTPEFYIDFLEFMDKRVDLIKKHDKDHYLFWYIVENMSNVAFSFKQVSSEQEVAHSLNLVIGLFEYYESNNKSNLESMYNLSCAMSSFTRYFGEVPYNCIEASIQLNELLRKYSNDPELGIEIIYQFALCGKNKKEL